MYLIQNWIQNRVYFIKICAYIKKWVQKSMFYTNIELLCFIVIFMYLRRLQRSENTYDDYLSKLIREAIAIIIITIGSSNS
jgi:CRISPR/Cas system-associated endoribonuclease Cas2